MTLIKKTNKTQFISSRKNVFSCDADFCVLERERKKHGKFSPNRFSLLPIYSA